MGTRRTVLAAFVSMFVTADASAAADFPAAPLRIIVPVAAGGGADTVARMLADFMQRRWGQSVIVDNRPGGNGLIGPADVARSKPDGYTLLLGTPSLTTAEVLVKQPTFDAGKDFAPISQIMESPYIVAVSAATPAHDVKELLALARAHPDQVNCGSVAGGAFLTAELFNYLAGVNITNVLYKGSAPAVAALAANEVQLVFDAMITLKPLIDEGKVRAIAVTTAHRAPHVPDLPTTIESGVPDFDVGFWFGVLAPAGTPPEIRSALSRAVADFVREPEVAAMFAKVGYVPLGSSPEDFAARMASDQEKWRAVARFAKIEPQ